MAKILLVDDSNFVRVRLSNILMPLGHTMIEAQDGQEAVDSYTLNKPDVVIMDITMPVKDGVVALKEILVIDEAAKVIMLTNNNNAKIIMETMRLGAKKYLVKPIEEDKVIEAVNQLLK